MGDSRENEPVNSRLLYLPSKDVNRKVRKEGEARPSRYLFRIAALLRTLLLTEGSRRPNKLPVKP
jgi:hypothetical protein